MNEPELQRVFTTYDIQACLLDRERVGYFQRAIEQIVKPGHVVVDAGSGTGLLGLLAAKAGASKVYCLEINDEFVDIIKIHAKRNGLEDRIEAICADATTCRLPEQVDVIISEVISAGFFYEPQLQILNNLRTQLKPGGVVIPRMIVNRIELIEAQEELYGLRFNYDTRYKSLADDTALTSAAEYLRTSFAEHNPPWINETVEVEGIRSGTANAARITYEIDFADGILGNRPTDFLLNPQIIFLREAVEVVKGAGIQIEVGYAASTSPLDWKPVIYNGRRFMESRAALEG